MQCLIMKKTKSNSKNYVFDPLKMKEVEDELREKLGVDLIEHKLSLTAVEWALLSKIVEQSIPMLPQCSWSKVEGIFEQILRVK